MGIDEDQLPRLFQEFHQAGVAKHRKYGGTGLGLAISRRLVGLMGGEIWATSEKGKGSEFTVRLPGNAPVLAEAA
jgi:signal transduction histidine kinase